jgi:hypothetical protein
LQQFQSFETDLNGSVEPHANSSCSEIDAPEQRDSTEPVAVTALVFEQEPGFA